MLGTLRLLLALAVAASHLDYRIAGLNPGVSAVIGFYLISGYVMAGLLQRHYPQYRHAPAFYWDRAVRLMPQYLFYLLLTLLWLRLSAPLPTNASLQYFVQRAPTLADYLNNLLIVPLNYYMFNGSDHYTLIPPAWSLGAEVQFYLLAPFILRPPKRLVGLLLAALVVVALALLGWLHSDWYGYRLLPGVLSYFLLGALLHHLHHRGQPRHAWAVVLLALALAAVVAWLAQRHGTLQRPYNQEVLLGLAVALPLLQLLARRPRRAWDDAAGDIAYGVFLNHFLIHWALYPHGVPPAQLAGFLALCVLAAWASQRWIEQPCLAWRQHWRVHSGTAT